MGTEAVDDTLADLLAEDGVGGDTFFFDEAFDLLNPLLVWEEYESASMYHLQCPKSS